VELELVEKEKELMEMDLVEKELVELNLVEMPYRCRAKWTAERTGVLAVVLEANVPVSEPTAIVEPDLTFGTPVERVNVPAPLVSVAMVPTVVPSMTTSSELLTAPPVTETVSERVEP
jgi:hypothetical protein